MKALLTRTSGLGIILVPAMAVAATALYSQPGDAFHQEQASPTLASDATPAASSAGLSSATDALDEGRATAARGQSASTGVRGCVRDPEWICDGDVDGDGQVNPVDSGLVQAAFGSMDEQDLCNYDVDCDGQINPVDSGIVQSLFGTCDGPRPPCQKCSGEFPEPGPMTMFSGIALDLFIDGEFSEQVLFDSELTVDIEPAEKGVLVFVATAWEAIGTTGEGTTITMRLTPDVRQPLSEALSLGEECDFPAAMTFRAIYDVFLNDDNDPVAEELDAIASGDVLSIPPGIVPGGGLEVVKSFAFGNVEVAGGFCAFSVATSCDDHR